jgi:hypothetical protein
LLMDDNIKMHSNTVWLVVFFSLKSIRQIISLQQVVPRTDSI